MKEQIEQLIQTINDSLAWFRAYNPEQYGAVLPSLGAKRLELRTMLESLTENPGIAAYGESQKGKSYLMSNLLQDNGSPFMVKSPDRDYNYVLELNPPGDGQEATGVVTRFTTFDATPGRYSAEHPVVMKVLRVYQAATILADAYHNDVQDYETWTDDELKAMSAQLIADYSQQPDIQNDLTEDDILAIKEYLRNYVNQARNLVRSSYLDTLASVIRKIPSSRWTQVLGVLWHGDANVNSLMDIILEILRRLEYRAEIYLDIDAIEHRQDKTRTIMSVQCLHGVYNPNFPHRADAWLRDADGRFRKVADFNRSHLSAVCREVLLKVEPQFSSCTMTYDTADLPAATLAKLGQRTSFRRDLLNHADLLDFPGARNRESLLRENLGRKDEKKDGSVEHNMTKLLLRGKIAYLFNHYNSARALNLLMFCHDAKNVAVTNMYSVLNNWIENYVGATPEQRRATQNLCGGVPPFFVISTMFNMSMVHDQINPAGNSETALNQRWMNRFDVLYRDSFHAGFDCGWFTQWTADGVNFDNTYVLRDFKFSVTGGNGSNLYDGYTTEHPREESMTIPHDHFALMRSTFATNSHVRKFMTDPESHWDLAATRNNDGSVFIIDRLTSVAPHLAQVRLDKFRAPVRAIVRDLMNLFKDIYVDTDGRDALREARMAIGSLRRSFDRACNADSYFFGNLIENLQVTTLQMYDVVHNTLNDAAIVTETAPTGGEIIRKAIEHCTTDDERYDELMLQYGLMDRQEVDDYLAEMGIDPQYIFDKDRRSVRVSDIVARRAFNAWLDSLRDPDTVQRACGKVLDPTTLGILTKRLRQIAELLGLEQTIAALVAPLVDIKNTAAANQYMVSDIIAITINDFVKDLGLSRQTDKTLQQCRTMDTKAGMRLFQTVEAQRQATFTEDTLTQLFTDMQGRSNGLTDSFYDNYTRWFACLGIAILGQEAAGGCIVDNPEANNAAGTIIQTLKALA